MTVDDSHVGLLDVRLAAVFAPLSQFAGDEGRCSSSLAVFSHLGRSCHRCGVISLRFGACGRFLPEHHRYGWLDLTRSSVGIVRGARRRLLAGAAIRLKKLELGLQSLGRRGGGARSGGGCGGHCLTRSPRSSGFE